MKIAVLSDIHGNQHALKAVLNELDQLSIYRLFLLGDFVGYYYGVAEVLTYLEKYENYAVRGNHEDLFSKALSDKVFFENLDDKYGKGHRMASEVLDKQQFLFLSELPSTLEVKLNGLSMLLCHGAPWGTDVYIYPDATESLLNRFSDFKYDYVFFGHTHYCSAFRIGQMQVINPGSVGQSREKGGLAYWGVLDLSDNTYEQRSTAYDISFLEQEVKLRDPDKKYNLDILSR